MPSIRIDGKIARRPPCVVGSHVWSPEPIDSVGERDPSGLSSVVATWASHGGMRSDEIRNRLKVFAQPSSPSEPRCVSPRTLLGLSTHYTLESTFCRFGPPPDSSGIFYLLLTHDYSLPLRPSPTLWLFREIMNIDLEPPNGIGRCELWDNVLPPFKARPAFVVSFSIASLESIA